jgi:hypothetical protein
MAWVVLGVGVVTSVLMGIAASTVMSKLGILLGGLAFTAVSTLMLIAASNILYLFIDIEQDLSDIKKSFETHLGH